MLEAYRFVRRFRVPFADVDMLAHANNIAYLRWSEAIRTEYVADVLEARVGGRHGVILARLSAVYERPLAYREAVAIGCRIDRIGTKSFDVTHEVWSDESELRCASVTATVVAMNYESKTTIAVPDEWRARIAAYEGTS